MVSGKWNSDTQMTTSLWSKPVQTLLEDFNQHSTDIDLALFLFAESIRELETIRNKLSDGIMDKEEIKKRMEQIRNSLSIASAKFKTNRMEGNQTILKRYLKLIDEIILLLA